MVTTTPPVDRSPVFVDANVLVYSDLTASPFYGVARQRLIALHTSGVELWLSRQILREYLVALTRGQSFSAAVSPVEAVASVEKIAAQFHVAEDTVKVGARLHDLVRQFDVKGKQVHDANVVATMQVYGIRRLLTHNVGDFDRFSSIVEVLPLLST